MREFTRVSWASEQARQLWEPRLQTIDREWKRVELASVAQHRRAAALVFGEPAVGWRAHGLTWGEVTKGRYVVARTEDSVRIFTRLYRDHDDERIGQYLGFPDCCRAFFHRVWNELDQRDTTRHMDRASFEGPSANILGRWMGVRLVPHLPCSFGCKATHQFAQSLTSLWHQDTLALAKEYLSWPVRYSALHGIAIITNPVLRVTTNTDYTASEVQVDYPGSLYPAVGARGLGFPFQQNPKQNQVTALKMFRNAVEAAAGDPTVWTDNGFTSKAAMDAAHMRILEVLGADRYATALDLGSGNGRLVACVAKQARGVEADATRIARAVVPTQHARIQDLTWVSPNDIILIMPGRLLEMSAEEAARVREGLRRSTSRLLVYAYGDWAEPGLRALTERAGLIWSPVRATDHAALLENF